MIELNVKLEYVSRFCYFDDTLGAGGSVEGAGGSVEEAVRARVRCAWAMFKELSSISTVRDALYHIQGKIYRACAQNVIMYRD